MTDTGYNVVFRCIDSNSPYEGAITWTTYGSREDLDKVRAHLLKNGNDVIAEGVSVEEAIALSKITPALTYLRVMVSKVEEELRAVRRDEILRQHGRIFVSGDDGTTVIICAPGG